MNNVNRRIAILGATGHIAKNLAAGFGRKGYSLYLYARNTQALSTFISEQGIEGVVHAGDFSAFEEYEYDVIINGVGIGDPAKLREIGGDIFLLTEHFDNRVLSYLRDKKKALYLNLSSGAAYGSEFYVPAQEETANRLPMNKLGVSDFYGITKLNTEAKHRAFGHLDIVDLRVFGFFSKYIDLQMPFFLTELFRCIQQRTTFVTGREDMVRDYVHPDDLLLLLEACMSAGPINDVFDVYSSAPATKFEIIRKCEELYGLQVELLGEQQQKSPTGSKTNYYSLYHKAQAIGYSPRYDSLTAIIDQFQQMR